MNVLDNSMLALKKTIFFIEHKKYIFNKNYETGLNKSNKLRYNNL